MSRRIRGTAEEELWNWLRSGFDRFAKTVLHSCQQVDTFLTQTRGLTWTRRFLHPAPDAKAAKRLAANQRLSQFSVFSRRTQRKRRGLNDLSLFAESLPPDAIKDETSLSLNSGATGSGVGSPVSTGPRETTGSSSFRSVTSSASTHRTGQQVSEQQSMERNRRRAAAHGRVTGGRRRRSRYWGKNAHLRSAGEGTSLSSNGSVAGSGSRNESQQQRSFSRFSATDNHSTHDHDRRSTAGEPGSQRSALSGRSRGSRRQRIERMRTRLHDNRSRLQFRRAGTAGVSWVRTPVSSFERPGRRSRMNRQSRAEALTAAAETALERQQRLLRQARGESFGTRESLSRHLTATSRQIGATSGYGQDHGGRQAGPRSRWQAWWQARGWWPASRSQGTQWTDASDQQARAAAHPLAVSQAATTNPQAAQERLTGRRRVWSQRAWLGGTAASSAAATGVAGSALATANGNWGSWAVQPIPPNHGGGVLITPQGGGWWNQWVGSTGDDQRPPAGAGAAAAALPAPGLPWFVWDEADRARLWWFVAFCVGLIAMLLTLWLWFWATPKWRRMPTAKIVAPAPLPVAELDSRLIGRGRRLDIPGYAVEIGWGNIRPVAYTRPRSRPAPVPQLSSMIPVGITELNCAVSWMHQPLPRLAVSPEFWVSSRDQHGDAPRLTVPAGGWGQYLASTTRAVTADVSSFHERVRALGLWSWGAVDPVKTTPELDHTQLASTAEIAVTLRMIPGHAGHAGDSAISTADDSGAAAVSRLVVENHGSQALPHAVVVLADGTQSVVAGSSGTAESSGHSWQGRTPQREGDRGLSERAGSPLDDWDQDSTRQADPIDLEAIHTPAESGTASPVDRVDAWHRSVTALRSGEAEQFSVPGAPTAHGTWDYRAQVWLTAGVAAATYVERAAEPTPREIAIPDDWELEPEPAKPKPQPVEVRELSPQPVVEPVTIEPEPAVERRPKAPAVAVPLVDTPPVEAPARTPVAVARPAGLNCTVKSPASVRVGDVFALEVRVENVGETTLDDVQLLAELNEQLAHDKGRQLQLNVGRLAKGESRTAFLRARGVTSGAASGQFEAVSRLQQVTATQAAQLTVTNSVSLPSTPVTKPAAPAESHGVPCTCGQPLVMFAIP